MAWHAKEVLRSIYDIPNAEVAAEFVAPLGADLQDDSCPVEVRSLGRTILRWRHQIAAWHQAKFTNAPTEAANNLIKRVKRIAFGFTRFRNYRVRVLLYAGPPPTATYSPRSHPAESEAPSKCRQVAPRRCGQNVGSTSPTARRKEASASCDGEAERTHIDLSARRQR